jgi:adenylate cyclase
MKPFMNISAKYSVFEKQGYRLTFIIAVTWTFVHFASLYLDSHSLLGLPKNYNIGNIRFATLLLHAIIIFLFSVITSYTLIFRLRGYFKYPIWLNVLIKSVLVVAAAFFINFLLHYTYTVFVAKTNYVIAFSSFYKNSFTTYWLTKQVINWVIIFSITALLVEVNQKYSPGVFFKVMMGKYTTPQIEKRIIMFMDLKNSTPIAEKLGHQKYFLFIKDFIYYISLGLLKYEGRIYQYIGDEIVVSWSYSEKNAKRCLQALINAKKILAANEPHFRNKYGLGPEFRVGIHAGEVTVGEIGLIKKELAMSGDTMNTAARIRNATSELNVKFIASEDLKKLAGLENWQARSLGAIDLKGKGEPIELFALDI